MPEQIMHQYARIQNAYEKVVKRLIEEKTSIATMESCTGGQIASFITNVDGSSSVFENGYVTYSNSSKVAHGVPAEVIDTYGVYSPQTAVAMATTCRENAKANIGIGVTGSLNTVDPANDDSECGVVYYCVVYNKNGIADMRTGDIRFRPGKSRIEMKLDIAEKIILLVQDLLFYDDSKF